MRFRAMARSFVPARTRSASDSVDPWIGANPGRYGRLAASAVTSPPDRHRPAKIFRWHGWEAGKSTGEPTRAADAGPSHATPARARSPQSRAPPEQAPRGAPRAAQRTGGHRG